MEVEQNHNNFNYFSFQGSHQKQNHAESYKNKESFGYNSDNERINKFQRELENYEKRKRHSATELKQNSNLFHFNFNMELIDNPEIKISPEKNLNSFLFSSNSSLIERKIESHLHYVGFENKYGENSCYINVILHFLYYFPSVYEFLTEFYKKKRDSFNNFNNIHSSENIDYFLYLLGKTLFEYQQIFSKNNEKGIIILNTNELRHCLQTITDNKFALNKVGDPAELLTFLLNEINNYNKLEIHNDFFINLEEEIKCDNCLNKNEIKKYDENNFIYYIYVNEIFQNIKQNNITFAKYCKKLFQFSYLNSLNNAKICKQCGNKEKYSIKYKGSNIPKYLLINCIWGKLRPDLKDVLKFLYLLPLENKINNLFYCEDIQNDDGDVFYHLFGMILYSPCLCHYINVIYNREKNLFVLYNDDRIKELFSIHEVYREITSEQLKYNPEVFYYPVLLIYYNENIYNNHKSREINEYTCNLYYKLKEDCFKAKNFHTVLTEEQKKNNYYEHIKAQIKFEKSRRRHSMKPNKNFMEMIIEEEQKDINYKDNDNFKYSNKNDINIDNDKKKEMNNNTNNMMIEDNHRNNQFDTERKRTNKRSGTQNPRGYPNTKFDYFPFVV